MAKLKLSTSYEADLWRKRLKRVRARQEDAGQYLRDLAQAASSEPPGAAGSRVYTMVGQVC
jgi:hypothetical protein